MMETIFDAFFFETTIFDAWSEAYGKTIVILQLCLIPMLMENFLYPLL
jgi:hypothetical protein